MDRVSIYEYDRKNRERVVKAIEEADGQILSWSFFAKEDVYKRQVQASGYDGIGIGIFNGICAIDLDNCVSDSGYYTQTAAEIVALMHSYTEYSPSGNGLHILF